MSEAVAIAEWRRAEDCRQVAQLCIQRGFYADAISRAYYATFHAAKASLALHGIGPRNHRGVNNMFSLHIVKTGLVEGSWGSVIGQLAPLRRTADHDVAVAFSEADAAYAYRQADAFTNRIHTLLVDTISPDRLQQRP